MAKILVQNGDWDAARAKLKTSLDAQKATFNAALKATFVSPADAAKTAAATPKASSRLSANENPAYATLPRSRLSN